MDWFFDGIGTEIISTIFGLMIGGTVGYKIGVKRTVRQIQKARDGSTQKQESKNNNRINVPISKSETRIRQTQKAGNNAVQTQIGEINNDKR